MAQMRIAYMLTSLGIGGAERQVIALAERMQQRGHTVRLFVLRSVQALQWPCRLEAVHCDIQKTPASAAAGLSRARRAVREFRPDLLHSHTYPANMCARTLRALGATPRVLGTIHNVYEGGWLRMFAYRVTDPLTRHTTAVSTAAAERFLHLNAVTRNKCTVLTNGIDTTEFAPNATRRNEMRSSLKAGNSFIWLAAGRITAAKDFPNMLQAFARVHQVFPHVQLWIAGASSGYVNISNSGALPAPSSIGDSLRWLGLRRDMPALLDAADGFVLSSAWEGMPLVVGEAMAMEKPVVATDVGGVRELLGDTGLCVPAHDSAALATAMIEVLQTTPLQRTQMGQAARARIQQQFSIDAKADQWEGLYASLL